jgi:hypothetical protein
MPFPPVSRLIHDEPMARTFLQTDLIPKLLRLHGVNADGSDTSITPLLNVADCRIDQVWPRFHLDTS